MSDDLHVMVTVARDDATGLPAVYLRDRAEFADSEQARDYATRLLAWVARRPLPGDPELPLFPARRNPWRPEQLEQILGRMDEWAPPPPSPGVFDQQHLDEREVGV